MESIRTRTRTAPEALDVEPTAAANDSRDERRLEELVLAAEDRRDGVVGEDVHDRLGEQLRDG